MKRFREIVQNPVPPQDKNVLWIDTSDAEYPKIKLYYVSGWQSIINKKPWDIIPDGMRCPFYYGATDNRILATDVDKVEKIISLNETLDTYVEQSMYNRKFYYICVPEGYVVNKFYTSCYEDITNILNVEFNVVIDNCNYILYMATLDSGIPLDNFVNIILKYGNI